MTGYLLSYSIVSGIILASLYLCYKLTMSRTTLFRFNRLCILLIYLLAGIAPFISFESGNYISIPTEEITVTQLSPTDAYVTPVGSTIKFILILYQIGVLVMALRFVSNILFLLHLKFTSAAIKLNDLEVEVRVVSNKKLSPFSWAGNIFIPASMLDMAQNDLKLIIAHEQSHIGNRHWLDLILSNLVIILQWYNPAAWLIHNELVKTHEFEADSDVIKYTDTPSQYQLLLIKRAAGYRVHTIVDSLNQSSLKIRISMMMKKQTKSTARLRALTMLPVLSFALCLANSSCVKSTCDKAEATDTVETEINEAENVDNAQESAVISNNETTASTQNIEPATIPEFVGGMANFYHMLSETIKYPQEAMDKNIEGRVIVELIVGKDGEISNATIKHGIEKSLDDEALAAIGRIKEAGGKFTPGLDEKGNPIATTFVVPISFKLQ